MVARYIILNRLEDPEDLKKFDFGGYQYMPDLSTEDRWEFHRDQPPPMNK